MNLDCAEIHSPPGDELLHCVTSGSCNLVAKCCNRTANQISAGKHEFVCFQEKEVQDLKAEISKLRIENRKQAKELNTLSKVSCVFNYFIFTLSVLS